MVDHLLDPKKVHEGFNNCCHSNQSAHVHRAQPLVVFHLCVFVWVCVFVGVCACACVGVCSEPWTNHIDSFLLPCKLPANGVGLDKLSL